MNRQQRRRAARAPLARVRRICLDCGAPYCPSCDDEMAECPDCGRFHCEWCGLTIDGRFVVTGAGVAGTMAADDA